MWTLRHRIPNKRKKRYPVSRGFRTSYILIINRVSNYSEDRELDKREKSKPNWIRILNALIFKLFKITIIGFFFKGVGGCGAASVTFTWLRWLRADDYWLQWFKNNQMAVSKPKFSPVSEMSARQSSDLSSSTVHAAVAHQCFHSQWYYRLRYLEHN